MASETSVLERLADLGTEQNRKIYRRHGVGENVLGVSYANLNKVAKELRGDHAVALRLWESGSHDARILATMVADPRLADGSLLDAWVGDLDNYVISDSFSSFAARTSLARDKMAEWIESDGEWSAAAGWNVLGQLALNDRELEDAFFAGYLERIEREIHGSKNRVRHSMNAAIIAIGLRSDALDRQALETASRIGKVIVDHGKTDCVTPDAAAYIAKSRARKKRG